MRISYLLAAIIGAMVLVAILPGSGLSKATSGNARLENLITNSSCSPAIEFTEIPPYGSFDNLKGRVICANPAEYKVVVYILVGSRWWVKPTFASPLTSIQTDSTWTTDITTGGLDQNATKIAAFLIPNGYNPPLLGGALTLPAELYSNAVAYTQVERAPRTLNFSGFVWYVKSSTTPVGPGPNYFSDATDDVWIDDQGRLHLKIVNRSGQWYSTEVYTQMPLGYGQYTFYVDSPLNDLDPNIVLGLFTWDGVAPSGTNFREIDIEVARFGNLANPNNAQFTVQPYTTASNQHLFALTFTGNQTTHRFNWQANRIQFASYRGHRPACAPAAGLEIWQCTGPDIPLEGPVNARINLWLFSGAPPTDGQEVEVIIKAFEFTPTPNRCQIFLPIIVSN